MNTVEEIPSSVLDEWKSDREVTIIFAVNEAVSHESYSVNQHISVERYSNYRKLLRVTALVLRFASNCRTMKYRNLERLSTEEIAKAENLWIKMCNCREFECFPDNSFFDRIAFQSQQVL